MSALDVFTYAGQSVRTVSIDGDPWFVLRDVCDVLAIAQSSRVAETLDEDEVSTTHVIDSLGREQRAFIVSEPGLYSVIGRSRKAEAKSFRRWVNHEVLPQIRRTGSYVGQAQLPQTYADALRAAADAWERNQELEAKAAIDAPKVEAFDTFMESDGTYRFDAAAKSLHELTGLGRNRLMAWLRDQRVLMADNTPYQRYAHWFKVNVSTYTDRGGIDHATRTTYVRPAGLDGIRAMWTRTTKAAS